MSRFFDKRLSSLKAYVPGEQPNPGEFIKLNTNEFPYSAAAGVSKTTAEAVGSMNLYSDLTCKKLKENFKRVFGYGGNNVIFTNGSDDALYLCYLAFCGENCGAAFADITYGFYSVFADLCCIEKQIIPLDDELGIRHTDYFGLSKTIFIANPNAPTGKLLTIEQIEEILINNKDNIVVIDEAYAAFSGYSCVELLPKYDNLVVVGTFSKSRGMAGARLGYIITSEEVAADLEKVKFSINPYNVNCLTQATGAAVLENNDYYLSCISEICDTRDIFSEKLTKMGFEVLPSKANFVFAKHSAISGKTIFEELRNKKILIRRFDTERIGEYLRISIGTHEQMNMVADAIAEIVGGKI